MPYRSDARGDEEGRRRRLREAEARFEEAKKRCVAAAGALARMRSRIEEERRSLDEAVAAAERDQRRALHAGLAAGGGDHERVRAALRAGGAVAALEQAMARKKGTAPAATSRPSGPPPPIEETKRRLREAREKRARLVAQQGPALERAEHRMAEAVQEHDDAHDELTSARLALGVLGDGV